MESQFPMVPKRVMKPLIGTSFYVNTAKGSCKPLLLTKYIVIVQTNNAISVIVQFRGDEHEMSPTFNKIGAINTVTRNKTEKTLDLRRF